MNDAQPFTRKDVLLLVLLAGLVALFFWRILTPNPADRAQFPVGDFTDQFYAFRLYQARAFAEGRIPLWSENFNSGHPFLADIQSAVFYPIALANTLLNLALFRSFSLFALELEALLHFYLAGAFTYLFARRVIGDRVGAFTSAIVFTFGGYLTSYPSLQLAILETAVWLPLVLLVLTPSPPSLANKARSREEPALFSPSQTDKISLSRIIAAGIVLGIAAMAGHPQTFLFVAAVSVIYFARQTRQARVIGDTGPTFCSPRSAFRILLPILLMLLIAVGVAAVQLIPAIEYQQLSTREPLSFADAATGFPTLDVMQFILPGYASAFASPLYVGILPLWLAIFALLRRRSETIFWGLLALGALILSFGFYVFAYVIFYLFVPGASLFRQQERLAFVVSFALAMLAGYGITHLLNHTNRRRAQKLYALLPVGAALMLALVITFFAAGAQNPQGRLAFLGDRAGLMLVQFALASVVLGLYLRNLVRAQWFALLAIVLILFDVWSVGEPANKGQLQDRFADIPFAAQLASDPDLFRVVSDAQLLPGHFGIPTRLEEIDGISPLRLARYDALLNLPTNVYLPLLNVKYAITRRGEQWQGTPLAQENELGLVELDSLPRAWLVGSAQVEADDSRTAQTLAGNFDFSNNALVSSTPPFTPDPRAAQGTVQLVTYSAEQSAFDTSAPADGLLVVSENFYPGWRATVDGQPAEILRANLTLRAVPVSAGQHRVEMWYDPLSFKLGGALSAITLAACIVALLVLARRND